MALTRPQIVDAGYVLLRDHGLAGLSMRALASRLGVQAGALYYHVASKQDLLAAVAERILTDTKITATTDAAAAACDIRDALLRVRDSAEVISFVYAFKPETLTPFGTLQQLIAARLPADKTDRADQTAHTLISYILGFVAIEQNRAELARAKVLSDQPSKARSDETFRFGIDSILRGLTTENRQQRRAKTSAP